MVGLARPALVLHHAEFIDFFVLMVCCLFFCEGGCATEEGGGEEFSLGVLS